MSAELHTGAIQPVPGATVVRLHQRVPCSAAPGAVCGVITPAVKSSCRAAMRVSVKSPVPTLL